MNDYKIIFENEISNILLIPEFKYIKKEKVLNFFKDNILKEIINNTKKNIDIKYNEFIRVLKVLSKDFNNILTIISSQNTYKNIIPTVTVDNNVIDLEFNINIDYMFQIDLFNRLINEKLTTEDFCKIREEFKVAVISPFSYGKSTLINALIGVELLRTDIRAETACLTKITFSNNNIILATKNNNNEFLQKNFKSNKTLQEKLKKLTSTRNDGNNLKEIFVECSYGIDNNITLIDTPGLFARYEHHNKLSEQALEEAGLVIFLLEPSRIGDSNYSAFLKKHKDYFLNNKKDLFFVIVKKDIYDFEEQKKIYDEAKIVLNDLGYDDELYFISAYHALKYKLYEDKIISLEDLKKDKHIFYMENGEYINGKNMQSNMIFKIYKDSNIDELKERILQSRILYY